MYTTEAHHAFENEPITGPKSPWSGRRQQGVWQQGVAENDWQCVPT